MYFLQWRTETNNLWQIVGWSVNKTNAFIKKKYESLKALLWGRVKVGGGQKSHLTCLTNEWDWSGVRNALNTENTACCRLLFLCHLVVESFSHHGKQRSPTIRFYGPISAHFPFVRVENKQYM